MTNLAISRGGHNLLRITTFRTKPLWIVAAPNNHLAILIPDAEGGLLRYASLAARHVYELAENGYVEIGEPHPVKYHGRQKGEADHGRPITLTQRGRAALDDPDPKDTP